MRMVPSYYRSRIAERLSCSPQEVMWRTVFLEKLNAIYYCVPKAAGSSVIRTITHANGSTVQNHNSTSGRRAISAERHLRHFWRAMNSPSTFRFAFVRNPYARAVSCYLDKIVGTDNKRQWLGLRPTGDISLLEFLEAVSRQHVHQMNRHWRPQSALLPIDLAIDFIGRLETFDTDLDHVLKRLGCLGRATIREDSHATHADKHLNMIGPREGALIRTIYGEDFARFGYQP